MRMVESKIGHRRFIVEGMLARKFISNNQGRSRIFQPARLMYKQCSSSQISSNEAINTVTHWKASSLAQIKISFFQKNFLTFIDFSHWTRKRKQKILFIWHMEVQVNLYSPLNCFSLILMFGHLFTSARSRLLCRAGSSIQICRSGFLDAMGAKVWAPIKKIQCSKKS